MNRLRKNAYGTLLLHFLFWMILFTLGRTIFLIYESKLLNEVSFGEILQAYWYGWKMDMSMAAYLLIIPYLLFSFFLFLKKSWLTTIVSGYTLFIYFIISIIYASELEVFKEWGIKLNYKAISYLRHPSEVAGVTSLKVFIFFLVVWVVELVAAVFLHARFIRQQPAFQMSKASKISFLLLIPGLLLLFIRGGFQQIPMNQSVAYFSKNNVLNNAAVNSVWNTTYSVFNNFGIENENPYRYFEQSHAETTVKEIYRFPADSNVSLLTASKPNVVMIILEGWSSDLVEPLGGYEGITPNFNELCNSGYLFTNIYAAGLRSHEGMGAIFSGYPGQPVAALTADPSKYPGIPVINKAFSDGGYYTFYGFGGELNYGNIKSYLVHAGFDKIIEGSDFPANLPRAKLGIHDEYAFQRFLEEINTMPKPCFASWFTLSSHAPYDIPVKHTLDINGKETGYINSVNYSDRHLGEFFRNARKEPWYNNTLFVMVADHGHSSPKNTGFYDPDYRKIPLLFYGEVLKLEFRGKTRDIIGSQTDLCATLLNQLSMDSSPFRWSKNLMNPDCPEFAYYSFDDGFGWIEPGNHYSYHNEINKYFNEQFESEEKKAVVLQKGKSYLQVAFQGYLDL